MAEYKVLTKEPFARNIVECFNKMGVSLTVEQDERGDYRVNLEPAVFVVHRGDNTVTQMRPFIRGSNSPSQALKELNEDVQNMCRPGTYYMYGQCRLLVTDPAHEDLKVYEMVDRQPVDTGNRVRLAPK